MRFLITITLLLILSACAFSQAAFGCTIIDRLPAVINEPGQYCLDRSHATQQTNNTAAITITASNVDLDLQRHTIANHQAGDGFCLNGFEQLPTVAIRGYEVANVSVHNGTLMCFGTGIEFDASGNCTDCNSDNRIAEMRISTSYLYGIFSQGSRTVVEHNQVARTGGRRDRQARAIQVQGQSNTIRNNDVMMVTGEGNAGIGLAVGYNNLVVENRVQQAATGYLLYGGAEARYRDNLTAGVSTRYAGNAADLGNNQ